MRMQLCRTKFWKSSILLAKNWIKCFPGKNQVMERKIWIDHSQWIQQVITTHSKVQPMVITTHSKVQPILVHTSSDQPPFTSSPTLVSGNKPQQTTNISSQSTQAAIDFHPFFLWLVDTSSNQPPHMPFLVSQSTEDFPTLSVNSDSTQAIVECHPYQ